MIYITDILYENWTFLSFTHKISTFLAKSEFICMKNDEQIVKYIDYPNMKNQKIISIGFLKDFTGQATSVLMSNEAISNIQIFNELISFKFGFYNEKNIKILKNLFEDTNNLGSKIQSESKNLLENLCFIYSPSRNYGDKIIDLLNNIDAELTSIVENNINVGGISENLNYQINILFLGGFNILVPIFDFFSKNNLINSTLVCEAINLVHKILSNGEENMVINNLFYKIR